MWSLVLQLGFIFGLFSLLRFLEGSAAMRGTKGEDNLPLIVKKGLRGIFLVLIASPLYALVPLYIILPLIILYLPSYTDLSELNGGRPSPWMKSMRIFKFVRNYFPLELVVAGNLDDKGKYILALQPHGMLPFGGMTNLITDCNNATQKLGKLQVRTLVASFCFYIPIYRELLLGLGMCDASRYSAGLILDSGKSLILVPGGATEALYASPDEDVAYIKCRKGFVKMAMTHGCQIVPVYSFNECCTYGQLNMKNSAVQWVKKKFQSIFGLSLPLITNIIPKRAPITTVVGNPISVPHLKVPTDEEVTKALDHYIEELKLFYAQYGPKYNVKKDKELRII